MNEGNSTLIRLPPKLNQNDTDQLVKVVRADEPEELARQGIIDAQIMSRVLRRGQTFAQYRILGFVASGGMGEIYAAERLEDDGPRRRPVALKVVSPEHLHDPDIIGRLEREAQLAASVFSKHTVGIYEYGVASGRGFVAMEFLFGEELFGRMRTHKVLPLKELAELAVSMLIGLEDIHGAEIVHRDIKPENIFLSKTRRGEVVKILDFGIARKFNDEDDPLLSKPGQIFGTPQYLSPEQCVSPMVDHRSDLYSLGVVLYECAAGNPPFDRDTPWATMLAHQQEPVPLLPSTLDIEFCEIIYKALAKKTHERWQSAAEMRQVIERWIDETSWTDGMPGMGAGFGPMDGVSFDDIAHQARSQMTQTPLGVPSAAAVARQGVRSRAASQSQELSPYDTPGAVPMFPQQEEQGAAPAMFTRPAASTPAPRAPKREPLMSAPIELSPTKEDERRAAARKEAQRISQVREREALPAVPATSSTSASQLRAHPHAGASRKLIIAIIVIMVLGALGGAAIIIKGKMAQEKPAPAPKSIIE